MKNIKVRITPQVSGTEVLAALLLAGYRMESHSIQEDILANVADWVFGNDSTLIGCSNREESAEGIPSYYEEHFVVNGQLVTKDYWTRPKTPEQKPVERPPLGLRPRGIVQQERIKEILDAMWRYAEAGVKIPGEWFLELEDLNETVKEGK